MIPQSAALLLHLTLIFNCLWMCELPATPLLQVSSTDSAGLTICPMVSHLQRGSLNKRNGSSSWREEEPSPENVNGLPALSEASNFLPDSASRWTSKTKLLPLTCPPTAVYYCAGDGLLAATGSDSLDIALDCWFSPWLWVQPSPLHTRLWGVPLASVHACHF